MICVVNLAFTSLYLIVIISNWLDKAIAIILLRRHYSSPVRPVASLWVCLACRLISSLTGSFFHPVNHCCVYCPWNCSLIDPSPYLALDATHDICLIDSTQMGQTDPLELLRQTLPFSAFINAFSFFPFSSFMVGLLNRSHFLLLCQDTQQPGPAAQNARLKFNYIS